MAHAILNLKISFYIEIPQNIGPKKHAADYMNLSIPGYEK